jgi:hypothetical protein
MGERTSGLELSTNDHTTPPAPPASPDETVRHLGVEIAALREELGGLVAELDRRRHDLLDVRLQARRHALTASAVAVALIGAIWGLVRLGVRKARKREAP